MKEGQHGNPSRRHGCQGDRGEVKGGSGQLVEEQGPRSFMSI